MRQKLVVRVALALVVVKVGSDSPLLSELMTVYRKMVSLTTKGSKTNHSQERHSGTKILTVKLYN